MRKHLIAVGMLCGATLIAAGCSSYYRVTDPASGNSYYTTKVEDAGKAGAVRFKDEKTGSKVTLQSSEVKELSEAEFKAGLAAKPTPKPSVQASPQTTPELSPQK